MTTKVKNSVYRYRAPVKDSTRVSLHRLLSDEDCEDFYNYLDWLDLSKNPNYIVLPLSNHYFYQPEDFRETEVLINLRCLNEINDHKAFLGKIQSYLATGSFFTGCFYNSKTNRNHKKKHFNNTTTYSVPNQTRTGFSGLKEFRNKLAEALKLKTPVKLSKENVRSLLMDTGLTVHDMTELNGKIYFCAQKRPDIETL